MMPKTPIFKRSLLFAAFGVSLAVTPASAAPVAPSARPPAAPGAISLSSTLERVYPFQAGYALRQGAWQAHATLSVANNTRVRQRATSDLPDSFDVNICLYNDSGSDYFYNVFWNRILPLPGRLALYDAQKHYVCDLLERGPGSAWTAKTRDWTGIAAPGYAGMILSVSLPYPSYRRVPPGLYTLQVIYFARLSKPPTDTHVFDPADLQELFRSNTVQITVLDPAVPKPAPSVETP